MSVPRGSVTDTGGFIETTPCHGLPGLQLDLWGYTFMRVPFRMRALRRITPATLALSLAAGTLIAAGPAQHPAATGLPASAAAASSARLTADSRLGAGTRDRAGRARRRPDHVNGSDHCESGRHPSR